MASQNDLLDSESRYALDVTKQQPDANLQLAAEDLLALQHRLASPDSPVRGEVSVPKPSDPYHYWPNTWSQIKTESSYCSSFQRAK
eukprot:2554767-Amphidinium_carterae.1